MSKNMWFWIWAWAWHHHHDISSTAQHDARHIDKNMNETKDLQWRIRSPARRWRAQQLWKRWAGVEVSCWCSLWFQIKIMRGNLGQNEAAPARGWHATSVGTIDSTVEHVKTQATNHFNDLLDGLELDACRQKNPLHIKKPWPDVFLACWRGRVLKRDVWSFVSRPNPQPLRSKY